jgi:YqaJ-like viral recombinase domain
VRIVTTTQRDEAWRAARIGMFTASRAADMMAKIQKGEAAARRNLRMQIVLETLTGVSQENGFVSPDMAYGTALEPEAFAAYEAATGLLAMPVGFLAHDTLRAGCSPDGMVDDGLLEIKCRKSANHLSFLRSRTIPNEAFWQVIHGMWITGAAWADYVSFDDRFTPSLRLVCVRVPRVQAEIDSYEIMARAFLRECEQECDEVNQLAMVTV